MEIDSVIPKLTEVFDLTHSDAEPGSRVRDIYLSQIRFDEQHVDKEKSASERLADWKDYLDCKLKIWSSDPNTVVAATDVSVPGNARYQAVAAAMVYQGGDLVYSTRYASGTVTAPDAELYTIWVAVSYMAGTCSDNNHFVVFTDCIAAAKQLVDPSIHSGQGHSLAVCRVQLEWFLGGRIAVSPLSKFPSKQNGIYTKLPTNMCKDFHP